MMDRISDKMLENMIDILSAYEAEQSGNSGTLKVENKRFNSK